MTSRSFGHPALDEAWKQVIHCLRNAHVREAEVTRVSRIEVDHEHWMKLHMATRNEARAYVSDPTATGPYSWRGIAIFRLDPPLKLPPPGWRVLIPGPRLMMPRISDMMKALPETFAIPKDNPSYDRFTMDRSTERWRDA